MTLKEAKAVLRQLGLSITKRDGEYRVNYLNGGVNVEATAYYTNDMEDAISTGKAMAKTLHLVR